MQANGNPANGVLEPQKAEELRLSINQFVQDSTEANTSIRPARKKVITSLASDSVQEVFEKNKVAVLTEESAGHISKAGQILRKFRAIDETIGSATHFKTEKAAETIAGNNWGDGKTVANTEFADK